VVPADLEIRILGDCEYPSPLAHLAQPAIRFVGQADRVLLDDRVSRTGRSVQSRIVVNSRRRIVAIQRS
jgi:hypothetical protein